LSFFADFFGIGCALHDQPVCCPFPHTTTNGLQYYEHRPSAHVNTEKHVFHCKACGLGYSEAQFIEHILGCSTLDSIRIQKAFESAESLYTWTETRKLSEAGLQLAESLGISKAIAEELHIASPTGQENSLQFPVFYYDQLMDIRTYTPGDDPKVRSRARAMNGLIIPFNEWRNSPKTRITILAAGEKDMAVTRSQGLNAITLTGGEENIPRCLEEFRDRPVAICYDNDGAGRAGALRVANKLYGIASAIKIVTGFHEICTENGEDLTDFFIKYKKTRNDLIQYIEQTPVYIPSPTDNQRHYPLVNLYTAAQPVHINNIVRSNIQVVAVTDTTFTIPKGIILEKTQRATDRDLLSVGECRSWEFSEKTLKDTLHLMDNNFTEKAIKENIKQLLYVPKTERFIKERTFGKLTVFKCHVTDLFETSSDAAVPMEFVAYSFDIRLESGKKYLVTHKLVPHPYKGQQLIMLIINAEQANDSITNFHLDETRKQHLEIIKSLPGSVPERIAILTEKVKGLLGYNGNNTLIQAIDLGYHTALQFNLGSFQAVRGYLDTLIVGESRVGKSSTAEALRQTYGLGVFISLAGNSATIPGLVGGSNKTASGFQTRAGVIPQNHKGLLIFEEFGKCKQDVVTELTDIRSSGEVRIARVSGTFTLPALVRMITLSNVKNSGNSIKPITSYPNGIEIIKELVGTAEDIARYDLMVVLPDKGNSQIDPYWVPEQPLPTEVYQTRIRWIWSRTPEQIIIERETGLYLMERSNALNTDFDCHIKIFGTEAWKKLARLSIAVAGYLVSTDESYENIVVLREHIDFAEQYFRSIYDNTTFKLREYVEAERKYAQIDQDGITALQDIYTKAPALVIQLSKSALCSKNMLSSASGISNDDLNKILSRLTKGLFIQYQGFDIVPTERFRLGFQQLNTATTINRLGEE
jgi:hypothetical protein